MSFEYLGKLYDWSLCLGWCTSASLSDQNCRTKSKRRSFFILCLRCRDGACSVCGEMLIFRMVDGACEVNPKSWTKNFGV